MSLNVNPGNWSGSVTSSCGITGNLQFYRNGETNPRFRLEYNSSMNPSFTLYTLNEMSGSIESQQTIGRQFGCGGCCTFFVDVCGTVLALYTCITYPLIPNIGLIADSELSQITRVSGLSNSVQSSRQQNCQPMNGGGCGCSSSYQNSCGCGCECGSCFKGNCCQKFKINCGGCFKGNNCCKKSCDSCSSCNIKCVVYEKNCCRRNQCGWKKKRCCNFDHY